MNMMLKNLANTYTKRNELTNRLGEWIDRSISAKFNSGFGNVKLAESTAIDAYKALVIDEKSPYY